MTETSPEFVPEAVTPAPAPVPAPEPAPEPEPDFVIVPRDQVEEYASRGWHVGYAMLRPE